MRTGTFYNLYCQNSVQYVSAKFVFNKYLKNKWKKWVNDHLSRASCVLICFSYIESIISGYLQNNPRRWELLFPFFREREQTQIDETITKVHTASKHWSSGLSPTSKCKGRATVPCWTLIWLSSVSLCLSPLSWSPCHGNCLASWSVYN